MCIRDSGSGFALLNQTNYYATDPLTPNPTGGVYIRISESYENKSWVNAPDYELSYWDSLSKSYWIKLELTGYISEIWSVNSTSRTFSRLA